MISCTCKLLSAKNEHPVRYDQSACPTHGPDAPNYFVDHDTIHCRITGKHVSLDEAAGMLNASPDELRMIAWGVVAKIGPQLREVTNERDSLRTSSDLLAANVAALTEDVAKQRAVIERLERERDEALKEVAVGEEVCDDLIAERDHREAQLDAIADALGDEGEWSNLHDRGDAALELASLAVAARIECERMQAVYEAALAWRKGRDRNIVGTAPSGGQRSETGRALIDAIDATTSPTAAKNGAGGMSEKLTDEEIDRLDTTASWLVNKPDRVKLKDDDERKVGMRVSLLIAEIRQRRAADLLADAAEDAAFQRGRESVEHWKQFATPVLTVEEREALAWARKLLSRSPLGPTMRPRALAALSKLLAAGGAK